MTAHYWPAKATALRQLAADSIGTVSSWAMALGLAMMPAPAAADVIRDAVADRVEYRTERGDHFLPARLILARGYDDCDGHAIIGAALAAAAGHPARIVGLSRDGRQPEHVRAEVGDASGWYPADSTFQSAPNPVLHHPVAYIDPAHPRPAAAPVARPVGGVLSDAAGWAFDTIGETIENSTNCFTNGGDVGDCLGTAIGDAVGRIFDPVARVGRYITQGPVVADLRRLITDPDMLAALGTIIGCTAAVTSGIGGLVLGPCAAASKAAWAILAAETSSHVGPARWASWSNDRRAVELRRAERALGLEELRRRARTAERIAMTTPDVLINRYPQIATIAMRALRGHPDGDVRTFVAERTVLRGDRDALIWLMRPHNVPNMRIRAAIDTEFDRAVDIIDPRLASIDLGDCPPIRPDTRAYLIRLEGTDDRWCLLTAAEREALKVAARLDGNPPIRPDVRALLERQYGDRWSAAWSTASPARRADYLAFARMTAGTCPRIRPDVRAYLRDRVIGGDGWAAAWCAADAAQRDGWVEEARARRRALDAIAGGLTLQPDGLSPDQIEDVNTFNRVRRSSGGGGGAALFGLAALLGLAFRKG